MLITSTAIATRSVGDKVYIHQGRYAGEWVIEKINPVNYVLKPPAGDRSGGGL